MAMRNTLNHLENFVDSCYRAEITLSLIAEDDNQLKTSLSDIVSSVIINHSILVPFNPGAISFAYAKYHKPIYRLVISFAHDII